jgi:hypothetical protein
VDEPEQQTMKNTLRLDSKLVIEAYVGYRFGSKI